MWVVFLTGLLGAADGNGCVIGGWEGMFAIVPV